MLETTATPAQMAMTVTSIGIRPCSGAVLVLLPLYRGVSTGDIERLLLAAGFTELRHFAQDFAASPYEGVTDDFFLLTASA